MYACVSVCVYNVCIFVNINRQEVQPIRIHFYWCVNEHLFLCGSKCNYWFGVPINDFSKIKLYMKHLMIYKMKALMCHPPYFSSF